MWEEGGVQRRCWCDLHHPVLGALTGLVLTAVVPCARPGCGNQIMVSTVQESKPWSREPDSEPQFPHLQSGDNHRVDLRRQVKPSEAVPAPSRCSVNDSCHHHDPRRYGQVGLPVGNGRLSRKPCEKGGREVRCSGCLLLRNHPTQTWTLEKATSILCFYVSVGRLGSAGWFCLTWSPSHTCCQVLPGAGIYPQTQLGCGDSGVPLHHLV